MDNLVEKYIGESKDKDMSIEEVKKIVDMIEKKSKQTLINRTSGYSPAGYYDFSARLIPTEFDGIQISLSFKPDPKGGIYITLGQYGMSNTNLDTVRQEKLKLNSSPAKVVKAFMKVLTGK